MPLTLDPPSPALPETPAVLPLPLLALTLRQPWATAVRDLGKRVENRSWQPPEHVVGQIIAIHAGKTFDERGADWIAARTGRMTTTRNVPMGAVVALARLAQVVTKGAPEDFWFSGPYGWYFDDVIELDPIPCGGRRQLWALPEQVRNQVLGQMTKSE